MFYLLSHLFLQFVHKSDNGLRRVPPLLCYAHILVPAELCKQKMLTKQKCHVHTSKLIFQVRMVPPIKLKGSYCALSVSFPFNLCMSLCCHHIYRPPSNILAQYLSFSFCRQTSKAVHAPRSCAINLLRTSSSRWRNAEARAVSPQRKAV